MLLSKMFSRDRQDNGYDYDLIHTVTRELKITYSVTKCTLGYQTIVQIDYAGEEDYDITYLLTLDKKQTYTKTLYKGITVLHMYHTLHEPTGVKMDVLEVS